MRVFVLVEPKFFAPPEVFPALMEGFAAWREAHRERMEAFEFFAGGGGGFGIFNVPDEATLNRMMVENPLTPYSELTVRPILDGDAALGQWREIMREMMDAAGINYLCVIVRGPYRGSGLYNALGRAFWNPCPARPSLCPAPTEPRPLYCPWSRFAESPHLSAAFRFAPPPRCAGSRVMPP
jgi:hypothetical protein